MSEEKTKNEVKQPRYTKEFQCNNCDQSFFKFFDYGTVAEKGACVYCGVTDYQLNRPKYALASYAFNPLETEKKV